MPEPRFPRDFTWAAATSAYQIEGAVGEDGRGVSIWDTFCSVPGNVKDGATGAVAADHYHRYAEDLDLMAGLGLRGYRFSVAWPRVQPTGTGRPEQRGLDFYRRLVDGLRERGLTPMATLFHWDLPQALQDAGGWENRDTAERFAEYAEIVYDALDIRDWFTVNEPKTVVDCGYRWGIHAPGVQDEGRAFVALHHLLLGHGLASRVLHERHPGRRVGPALNLHPTYAADETDDDPALARVVWDRDGLENRVYLDPVFKGAYPADTLEWIAERSPMPRYIRDGDLDVISEPVDLLGVQYYNSQFLDREGNRVLKYPTAQLDWLEIHPRGLYDLLVRLKDEYPAVPIVITENGMCSPDEAGPDGRVDDPARVEFLRDHLDCVGDAIAAGVPVEGYCVWSFLDNFEWAEGYGPRFGIVHVDYETQRRTPKSSALWYRDVIAAGDVR